MKEFAVTFGQKYREEVHPKVKYAHPDGYLVVEAAQMNEARQKAFNELGQSWAFIYPIDELNKDYFPLGELHRI